jgi:5-carboxymethyl-2-hydroxymuconic-semialdehyde dehydrogenase
MEPVFSEIGNLIGGREVPASTGARFDKINPHDGSRLWVVARSDAEDVARAVATAGNAAVLVSFPVGRERSPVDHNCSPEHRDAVAGLSRARPASRSQMPAANGGGRIARLLLRGEGQRLYGRTTTSRVTNSCHDSPPAVGVAELIIAANTLSQTAWFPAHLRELGCSKSAEDTPATAALFGGSPRSGLPHGVLNIVHGWP